MKNMKTNLPNILTLINMSLGVTAILLAVNGSGDIKLLIYASLLILFAALTDRFDGKVARLLDCTSELGKELDSLSDLISFGVAPIIIAWKVSFWGFGIPGYAISLIFPMAGAYRLAKFNTTTFDTSFKGMPITLAGAFLTIDNLFNAVALMSKQLSCIHVTVTSVLIILLSYLMISKIRFKKV